jgi:hypothetical protein
LTPKDLYYGNYISCLKGQFSTPEWDSICLGQKFYNDATQENQWWGAPNHTEPQPHWLANFPKFTIAQNNLNLSNCYSQINDEKKVIKEITNEMKKLAHVPVQTWKGRHPNELFRGWFSTLGGFKTFMGQCSLS